MEKRKTEKIAVLAVGLLCMGLALFPPEGWRDAALFHGCPAANRLSYMWLHSGALHAAMNVWCLISIVFIYNVSWRTLLCSVAVAASVPSFAVAGHAPTVGMSGAVFYLLAWISYDTVRRLYFHAHMAVWLALGFCFSSSAATLHLWCYACGLASGTLCKPVIRRK